jgi:hypothetical protein
MIATQLAEWLSANRTVTTTRKRSTMIHKLEDGQRASQLSRLLDLPLPCKPTESRTSLGPSAPLSSTRFGLCSNLCVDTG